MSRATSTGKRKAPRASTAALKKLGADRLAELLVAAAKSDPALKRALTLEVATEAADVSAEVDRQLDRMRMGGGRLNAAHATKLARELAGLIAAIASKLGALDPSAAVLRLTGVLELAPVLLGRCTGEGRPLVEAFSSVSSRIADVLPLVPSDRQAALVEPLHRAFMADRDGFTDELMAGASRALHSDARGALRDLVVADLAGLPTTGRGGASQRLLRLTAVLAHIADAEGDPDAFLAAQARRAPALRDHMGGAERLLAADRAAEALAILDAAPVGAATASAHFARLRIQVLDALGRRDEAQTERWRHFQSALSVDALRQHLKRMPDFDDVEREQQALTHATAHPDTTAALAFLISWPDHRKAAALVRARQNRLDGSADGVLGPAAYALAHRDPLAATLLFRALIDWALASDARGVEADAARHLAECSALAGSIADWEGRPDHMAYVIRLRNTFGRKAAFWRIVSAAI